MQTNLLAALWVCVGCLISKEKEIRGRKEKSTNTHDVVIAINIAVTRWSPPSYIYTHWIMDTSSLLLALKSSRNNKIFSGAFEWWRFCFVRTAEGDAPAAALFSLIFARWNFRYFQAFSYCALPVPEKRALSAQTNLKKHISGTGETRLWKLLRYCCYCYCYCFSDQCRKHLLYIFASALSVCLSKSPTSCTV